MPEVTPTPGILFLQDGSRTIGVGRVVKGGLQGMVVRKISIHGEPIYELPAVTMFGGPELYTASTETRRCTLLDTHHRIDAFVQKVEMEVEEQTVKATVQPTGELTAWVTGLLHEWDVK